MSEEFVEKPATQAERFQRDPLSPTVNTVYLRVKSDQVRGLLGSKYAVPTGFIGLVVDGHGKSRVLMPGEEATGEFTLHLLRDREVRMPFTVLRAKSKDGFDHSVSFELALTPDVARREAMEAFIERGAVGRRHLDWPLLKGEVQPQITAAVSAAILELDAAELARPESFERVRQEAAKRGAEGLSRLGIGSVSLEVGRIRSETYTHQVDEKQRAEQERERAKAEQQVQAAILKDQLGEELSRKELEDFLASAREDGLLKQHERVKARIKREAELDRVQAEYQRQKHSLEATLKKLLLEKDLEMDSLLLDRHMEVVKRMREELSDDRIEVYINVIKDERLKAELLHRLIQRQMTPEQLKAVAEIEASKARLVEVSNPNLEPVREHAPEHVHTSPGETIRVEKTDAIARRDAAVESDAAPVVAAESDAEAVGSRVVNKSTMEDTESEATDTVALEAREYVDSMHLTEVAAEAEKKAEKNTEKQSESQKGAARDIDTLALVACGRHVYAIDPFHQKGLDDAPLDLSFEAGGLGSLRSVRMAGEGRDRVVLAGARNGVYAMLVAHGKQPREFPIANNVDARTGINAAVLFQGFIYATHSEFGLLRWPYLQPYSPSTQVMPELTARFSTTRGIDIYDGRLLFANGPTVLLLESAATGSAHLRVAARYEGTRHEVTALTHDGQYVLIADTAGDVYVWEPRASSPPALAFRAGTSVADLATTTVKGGRKALLVAIKRVAMPLLFREGGAALEFVAPEPLRSCDALNGTVIGLSRDRMRVFTWSDIKPEWPSWQFQFAEPVLDIQLLTPQEAGVTAPGVVPAPPVVAPGPQLPPGYK